MIKTFKMKLYEGQEKEYERRHNELWPEMIDMIHEHGGKNYTICLDKETLTLFCRGVLKHSIADIMETNPDNSPVAVDLPVLFHLD